jgi:hypothetical protein
MVFAETARGSKPLCHDCKKELEISEGEIRNGVELVYEDNGEKVAVLKCSDCYQKNPSLANYRQCEVYSRIVGYLRPVQQWHKGKKQEFKDRREFKES